MPRYEQLKLNNNKTRVPKRIIDTDDSYIVKDKAHNKKMLLAKPLIVASSIIIIFAIIFSTIKTYGEAVSIATKDFFRVPQMEARSLDALATIATNEQTSFLSNLPMFNFFVRPEDNNIVAITAEESTNNLFETRGQNITEDMFKEFEATTRITRDALLPFFNNNKINTHNSNNNNNIASFLNLTNSALNTNGILSSARLNNSGSSTNNSITSFLSKSNSALNTNSILSSIRLNNSGFNNNNNNIFAIPNSILQNTNNMLAKNDIIKNNIVEASPFKEILKPQKEAKPRSTMKPVYTKRYRQHETNLSLINNDIKTNKIIYDRPIAKNTKSRIIKPTQKEIEKNREEFYKREAPTQTAVRKISNPPNATLEQKEKPVTIEVKGKDNLENNKVVVVTKIQKNREVATSKKQDDNIIVPSAIPKTKDDEKKNNNVVVNSYTYIEESDNIIVMSTKKSEANYTQAEDDIDIVIPSTYIAMNNENINPQANDTAITPSIKNEINNTKTADKNISAMPLIDNYTDNRNNIMRENMSMPTIIQNNEEDIYVENNSNIATPQNNIERSIQKDAIKENNNIENNSEIIIPSPIPQNIKEESINNTAQNNDLNNENDIIGNEKINIIDNSNNNNNIFTKVINDNQSQIPKTVPQKNIERVLNKSQNPGIFLAEYDDELGTITLVFKERNLRKNYTLEDILLSLLDGASDKENENNIISVIPRTAKLLDVFRENNTLYLNFSSDFEYNPLGDEGMLVQLYQIVYTVTQFENINEVIFLVDGNHNEFIGAEGSIANIPFRRLASTNEKVLETYN